MKHRLAFVVNGGSPTKSIAGVTAVVICVVANLSRAHAAPDSQASLFRRENLVAWCIVPFDAKKRTPAQRAEMLEKLGFTKLAYDWRDPQIPTFEDEVIECKKRGIEFFAFWGWRAEFEPLIHKYGIHPQIWMMAPSPEVPTQQAKVEASARSLEPLVEKTRQLGLKFGLYGHDDWGGQPDNLVAVCKYMREHDHTDHVGIVYNFHHGHDHITDFPQALAEMKPYLLCLNLNGMNATSDPLVLPIGSGKYEKKMIQDVVASGYRGPIGIIHHREQLDAEEGLRQNISGLKRVLKSIGDTADLHSFGD